MATNRVYEWVDERTGIKPAVDYVMYRRLPKSVNWFFTLGSASLTVFLVQAVSGIFLAMGYSPSTAAVPIQVTGADGTVSTIISNEALESVRNITQNVFLGDWIRGFHHWGANAMVIVVVLHMLRVFFMGSYKYPRELTWFIGVFILLMVLGFSFTGYLLPWDNRAYWATQVGINIGGAAPFLGDYVATALRGGPTLGAATLTRFYAIHVLILPAITALLISLHLFLIIKIGISGQPKYREATSGEFFESASLSGKKSGKAFFPYIIFKDAVVSVAVVAIIVLLTIFVPVGNTNPVDPQNNYDPVSGAKLDPRPEWYFLFLYQLLKIIPNIDLGFFVLTSKAIGGIIIPTIVVAILFFVPYLDRGPKRHPLNRPISTLVTVGILLGIIALTVVAQIENPGDLNQAGEKVNIEETWQNIGDKKGIKPVLNSNGAASAANTPAAGAGAGAATPAAARAGGAAAPAPASSAATEAGLKVFVANCTVCHAQNGKAKGIGPNLVGSKNAQDETYVRTIVRNGKGNMAAIGPDRVSDADLDKVVAYVKSLNGK